MKTKFELAEVPEDIKLGVNLGNCRLYSGERGGGGFPSLYIDRKRRPEEVTEDLPESRPVNIAAIHPTAEELKALIVHLKWRLAYTTLKQINEV